MARSKKEGFLRPAIGGALNVALWFLMQTMAGWSSYDREVRSGLICGAIAAMAIVSVLPIFWRGDASQVPVAFVLLWLPAFALYSALRIAVDL
jgi:hypothetical protein